MIKVIKTHKDPYKTIELVVLHANQHVVRGFDIRNFDSKTASKYIKFIKVAKNLNYPYSQWRGTELMYKKITKKFPELKDCYRTIRMENIQTYEKSVFWK